MLALSAELGDRATPVEAATLDADPVRASYEAAAMSPLGPFDQQQLLELDDPLVRLTALDALLTDAAELLELRLAAG